MGVRCGFGEPRPEELDGALLVWTIHQRINRDLLPETPTIVEVDHGTSPAPRMAGHATLRGISVRDAARL
jgi:hypothetical protein